MYTISLEVIILANINCTHDCIYQKNGMCECDNISNKILSSEKDCVYYQKNTEKKEKV